MPPLSEGRFDHQPLSRETRSRHSSHHAMEVQFDLNIFHLRLTSGRKHYPPTTYIHPHPHSLMSLTPTFILPYITLQGCSGAPGPRPAYKHSLSAPIHAHVVPVQYGDTYGVTQGHPGPTGPRTSQCQPKTQHIRYFCLSQR